MIEGRRDQVRDRYVRLLESEREVADRLGLSLSTVHSDLRARHVTMRPQARGLNRGLTAPEHLHALQDGHRRYRSDVERAKGELGLINRDELLKRLRRAGVPRSTAAIVGFVRDGLIEPERGLGFDKPWLFTTGSADALVRRLLSKYQDGRLTRFNPTTPQRADWRRDWVGARHGPAARASESGRLAPLLGKGAERSRSARGLEQQIIEALASGMTRKDTALLVSCSERYVREVAHRRGLPPGRPGRPRNTGTTPPRPS